VTVSYADLADETRDRRGEERDFTDAVLSDPPSARGRSPAVQLVLHNLPAQRVPMNAQDIRRPRLIAIYAVEHALNEPLLKFHDGFIE
jgi:hypothetical protein